jgi:hypothetical protein
MNENDVNFAINAVEKIRNFKPFFDLRKLSGSAALPPLSPLRTVRAAFTAYGSSDY